MARTGSSSSSSFRRGAGQTSSSRRAWDSKPCCARRACPSTQGSAGPAASQRHWPPSRHRRKRGPQQRQPPMPAPPSYRLPYRHHLGRVPGVPRLACRLWIPRGLSGCFPPCGRALRAAVHRRHAPAPDPGERRQGATQGPFLREAWRAATVRLGSWRHQGDARLAACRRLGWMHLWRLQRRQMFLCWSWRRTVGDSRTTEAASHQPCSPELQEQIVQLTLIVASPSAASSRLMQKMLESKRQPSAVQGMPAQIRSSLVLMSIPAAASSSRLAISASVILCEEQDPASAAILVLAQQQLPEQSVTMRRQ